MNHLSIGTIKNNKTIIINVISAFVIKGLGLVVNLIALPLYISYFNNNTILGVWFTALTVLNWILSFDVGIGNGLRNRLTVALAQNDFTKGKSLISSSFFSMGIFTMAIAFLSFVIFPYIEWNDFFNVPRSVLSQDVLLRALLIIFCGILLSFFLNLTNSIIYAMQLSSINNLKNFVTSVFLVLFLLVAPTEINLEDKLIQISWVYSIIINLSSFLLILWIFLFTQMKRCKPSWKSISRESIKQVLGLGLSFFSVQVLYMLLTITNEWFILYFFSPDSVVDYQVYYRIFSLIGSLIMLSMAPLWSAITKAYAEKKFNWIIKLQRFLYIIVFGCILFQLLLFPFLQILVDLWLGEKAIRVDYVVASSFLLYSISIVWIAILSTLVAGLGLLKVQLYCYIYAVVFKIIGVLVFSNLTDNWDVVIWVTFLGLLPYCIIQPIYVNVFLKKMIR